MKIFKIALLSNFLLMGSLHPQTQPLPRAQEQPMNTNQQVILPGDMTNSNSSPKYNEAPLSLPVEDTGGGDRFTSELVNMLMVLGILLAAMLGVTWFLRKSMNARMAGASAASNIIVVDSRKITTKSTVYLLEVNGKAVLVGESTNGLVSLDSNAKLPPEEVETVVTPTPTEPKKPGFDSFYKK